MYGDNRAARNGFVMKIRVGYVEDEDDIRENYTDLLQQEGLIVEAYAAKDQAIEAFKSKLPDLALLDVTLHGERDAGFEICTELRKMSSTLPIIFLTGHAGEIDKISGLRLDADDYITKGVSIDYIVVRIEALFRRHKALTASNNSTPGETSNPTLIAHLLLDDTFFTVTWKGTKINLSLTQFWMLQELCHNPGQVKSKRDLMVAAKIVVEPNTIAKHIKAIRDAFKEVEPEFDCICTVRGQGYRWIIS